MLKPTKNNQTQWIREHLNGGKCPKSYNEWLNVSRGNRALACHDALLWLRDAKPDITTLAEAWERCPQGDWLIWALSRMCLTKSDIPKVNKLLRLLVQAFPTFEEACAQEIADVEYECEKQRSQYAIELLEVYVVELLFTRNDREGNIKKTNNKVIADLTREVFGNPWE